MHIEEKRATGRYYTRGNPFQLKPFRAWAAALNLNQQHALEPFAGDNSIPRLLSEARLQCREWALFDIEPAAAEVRRRDTLADFPRGFEVCITNPPWLARNSATRRGLPFPRDIQHDDLYKYALEKCLANCKWVAAIIPEAFIRSRLFLHRLHDFVSLVPQMQPVDIQARAAKARLPGDVEKARPPETFMFADTEHPVGLALFGPAPTVNTLSTRVPSVRIWRNNQFLGTLSELRTHLPMPSRNREIVFNEPTGNVGLVAVDNTVCASICFCPPAELAGYPVRYQGRSITKLRVPWQVDVENLNARLTTIRERTHDVFLTAFKGLRRDGQYRRRLDWALARAIVDAEHPQTDFFLTNKRVVTIID